MTKPQHSYTGRNIQYLRQDRRRPNITKSIRCGLIKAMTTEGQIDHDTSYALTRAFEDNEAMSVDGSFTPPSKKHVFDKYGVIVFTQNQHMSAIMPSSSSSIPLFSSSSSLSVKGTLLKCAKCKANFGMTKNEENKLCDKHKNMCMRCREKEGICLECEKLFNIGDMKVEDIEFVPEEINSASVAPRSYHDSRFGHIDDFELDYEDPPEDLNKKYLKYKMKYLKLKKLLNLN
jgi:hypothetical protein